MANVLRRARITGTSFSLLLSFALYPLLSTLCIGINKHKVNVKNVTVKVNKVMENTVKYCNLKSSNETNIENLSAYKLNQFFSLFFFFSL